MFLQTTNNCFLNGNPYLLFTYLPTQKWHQVATQTTQQTHKKHEHKIQKINKYSSYISNM